MTNGVKWQLTATQRVAQDVVLGGRAPEYTSEMAATWRGLCSRAAATYT